MQQQTRRETSAASLNRILLADRAATANDTYIIASL
jgi:hypothetical protein